MTYGGSAIAREIVQSDDRIFWTTVSRQDERVNIIIPEFVLGENRFCRLISTFGRILRFDGHPFKKLSPVALSD
jgi:hypothetical protein